MRLPLLAALFVFSVFAAPAAAEEAVLTYGPDRATVELTIERPPGLDDLADAPLIVALPPGPGTGQMVDAILSRYVSREAAARGYVVVSPAIFGPSLKEEAATFVPALFTWMEEHLQTDPTRTAIVGASNGGLGAFVAATAFPDRFACVATFPGALSGGADLPAAFAGKPFRMYVGGDDRVWLAQARRTEQRLREADATVELTVLPGQGHVVQIDTAGLFDWIDAHTPAPATPAP